MFSVSVVGLLLALQCCDSYEFNTVHPRSPEIRPDVIAPGGRIFREALKAGRPAPTKQLLGTGQLDCPGVFNYDREATASSFEWKEPETFTEEEIAAMGCDEFLDHFYFPTVPLSEEEAQFPLAYVLLVHSDIMQTIRLLQSVYWPQNHFCIHIDAKTFALYRNAIRNIARCLPNIRLVPLPEKVYWAHPSILNAAFRCMQLLAEKDWKYVQILSHTDVPLKTNLEMVRIFKILNGSNDVEMQTSIKNHDKRYVFYYQMGIFKENVVHKNMTHFFSLADRVVHQFFWTKKDHVMLTPPHNVVVYKGSFAASLTKPFVEWMVKSPQIADLMQYAQEMYIPDEFLWTTANHNLHLGAPNHYPGACRSIYEARNIEKPWISRDQMWDFLGDECYGKFTHSSCVYGVGDIPRLKKSGQLMAHKFQDEFEPAGRYCLLELHYNRTYLGRDDHEDRLSYSFYDTLPAVKYQKMSEEQKEKFVCL